MKTEKPKKQPAESGFTIAMLIDCRSGETRIALVAGTSSALPMVVCDFLRLFVTM